LNLTTRQTPITAASTRDNKTANRREMIAIVGRPPLLLLPSVGVIDGHGVLIGRLSIPSLHLSPGINR